MSDYFSPAFAIAQARFREAAIKAGGTPESIELDARGPAGEPLAIDIARFGEANPRRVFVHSSGLHGVEGFAGSAIQLQWLAEGIGEIPDHAGVTLVHVINPWGMAWLRRFNENNVDLNRNFLDAETEFAGSPPLYAELDGFLNPPSPPSYDLFRLRAAGLILRHGIPSLRQTIAGGQYDFPRGLFFGGGQCEQSTRRLQAYAASRFAGAERLVAVDVHTGLGDYAEDTLMVDSAEDRVASLDAMQRTYGDFVRAAPYTTVGSHDNMHFRLFPGAQIYFATQEFGTYRPLDVLAALRAENRWHHYGGGSVDHPAKQRLREVFCPEDQKWRNALLQRGREVIRQGMSLAFG